MQQKCQKTSHISEIFFIIVLGCDLFFRAPAREQGLENVNVMMVIQGICVMAVKRDFTRMRTQLVLVSITNLLLFLLSNALFC